MRFFFKISIICFATLLAISCNKKKDTVAPVIDVSMPVSGKLFAFGDTIVTKAKISDDRKIIEISVSLIDNDNNLVNNPVIINPDSKTYNLEEQIVANINVSGKHYVQIKASDGTNIAKSFVEVNIEGQQQTQKGTFVFSNTTGNCQVFLLDNNLNLQYQFNNQYAVLDAVVNSNSQQIYILGNQGTLSVYNINNYNTAWTKSNINDFQNNFKGCLKQYDNLVFVSCRNGNILGFDANGVVRQSATISEQQYFPSKFTKHGDYFIVALENDISLTNKIEKIYYSTGVPIANYNIDFEVMEIFSFDNDKAIIWGNKNNSAKICTLSVLNNVIYEMNIIPAGTLFAVEQIEQNIFLFCIDNNILVYNSVTDIFSDYKQNVRADLIRYDNLTGYLYLIDTNTIRIYDYLSKTPIKEINLTNNINDMEFWFNK